eukprot:Tamp_35540.p1 GENE.Tamp_35540~~Tamp_35540.p1  ORF type:complete len:133 (+),score=13.64 Tamp_35540:32-430(+)
MSHHHSYYVTSSFIQSIFQTRHMTNKFKFKSVKKEERKNYGHAFQYDKLCSRSKAGQKKKERKKKNSRYACQHGSLCSRSEKYYVTSSLILCHIIPHPFILCHIIPHCAPAAKKHIYHIVSLKRKKKIKEKL